jgi:dUTP pyrophosphatase
VLLIGEQKMKIKKKFADALLPTRGSAEAAGWDLYAYSGAVLNPHETCLIDTGIIIEVPKGYFGGIFARSGLALKKGLRPANAVGVVDSDYRDSVKVALHNDSNKTQEVTRGDRIAQLIIIPYKEIELEVVDEVSETERGQGGFGSTGK